MSTTTATQIREAIKARTGHGAKDVSVRTDHGSFRVQIMSADVDFEAVKDIAQGFESIRRDERSGDILKGCNTFVFVNAFAASAETVEVQIKPTRSRNPDNTRVVMFGQTPAGWFETGFGNRGKALASAERRGWSVVA